MYQGLRNRAIRSTDYNAESSRSHTILQLQVKIESENEEGHAVVRQSVLSLVDLAGSEKYPLSTGLTGTPVGESGSVGLESTEGQVESAQREHLHINTSLHTLGNCVSALVEMPRRKHVPFRDSVLTRLLQVYFLMEGVVVTVLG